MNQDAAASSAAGGGGQTRAHAAFITLDARGIVTAWSPGARLMLGYASAEAVGRSAAELFTEDLPLSVPLGRADRQAWTGEVVVRHRDGHQRRLGVDAHALLNAAGEAHWLLEVTEARLSDAAGGNDEGDGHAPDTAMLKQWALDQIPLPMALFDRRGLAIAANAATERTMGMPEQDLRGLHLGEYAPGQAMEGLERIGHAVERVLRAGETVAYEAYLRTPGETRQHAWLLSLYPVKDPTGRVRAMSMAAMDTTEQFQARRRLSVLNEAGLRIGTTLDVGRTAEELAEVATDHFADFVLVDLLDGVLQGQEPDTTSPGDVPTFRRTAQHSVLVGCPEAVVPIGTTYTYPTDSPPARALNSGRASHYQLDAQSLQWWASGSPERARRITAHGIHSMMVVPLQARDVMLGLAIFARHRTADPFGEDDLLLAQELAARAAVCVDNARRYTHERATALALQRSLLPLHAPAQTGVDVASRYLPTHSRAGIGGDWFDVIPLSGARVALVVGDVVGHGVHATATMGRLRTAVRTLADVDLAPDELLTHLDDLVLRLDREGTVGSEPTGESTGEVGATCLYAVYDPISRRCSTARAGHPLPALVTPDGTVDFLDVPAGPPLGVGGLPFEVAEFDIPEGGLLALYTDGLVEAPDRDPDDGYALLRDALSGTDTSLEETCEKVLRDVLPDRPTDDAALLLVRTHTLRTDRVATWDLPSDPVAVGRARELARTQLSAWELDDAAFTTELVVSELVTNAIRYGSPPVQLRLIRDTSLICEVSDTSSASPHLRRARVFDEGGRGLLIVAQLTDRWGSRHTGTGKTIWAEQALPGRGLE
ncbi:SpoIIE family protein phosphatase [Streptomyces sp. NPDC048623]|uniref:SpoIIE family protein phosphatase n=1 Tax=Streptomyces sp. NPDC048623 TaxID=3155761 RepID=UPI00342198FF